MRFVPHSFIDWMMQPVQMETGMVRQIRASEVSRKGNLADTAERTHACLVPDSNLRQIISARRVGASEQRLDGTLHTCSKPNAPIMVERVALLPVPSQRSRNSLFLKKRLLKHINILLFSSALQSLDLVKRVEAGFGSPQSFGIFRRHEALFPRNHDQIIGTSCTVGCYNPSMEGKATASRASKLLHQSVYTSSEGVNNNNNDVVQRLELSEQFNRWKFLQDLLEGEVDYRDVNELLYCVFHAYLHSDPTQRDESSPKLTESTQTTLRQLLSMEKVVEYSIPLFQPRCIVPSPSSGVESAVLLMNRLESLLPDPIEQKDAHDGLWDTIEALHGWEGVRLSRQNPCRDWDARCTVARVLIWFDFLAVGVLSEKEYLP